MSLLFIKNCYYPCIVVAALTHVLVERAFSLDDGATHSKSTGHGTTLTKRRPDSAS